MTSNDPQRLALSRADVAKQLGLSVGTVDNLIRSGELPAFRIGSSVRIPADELEKILARRIATP